jgi:hypothetical protein
LGLPDALRFDFDPHHLYVPADGGEAFEEFDGGGR